MEKLNLASDSSPRAEIQRDAVDAAPSVSQRDGGQRGFSDGGKDHDRVTIVLHSTCSVCVCARVCAAGKHETGWQAEHE